MPQYRFRPGGRTPATSGSDATIWPVDVVLHGVAAHCRQVASPMLRPSDRALFTGLSRPLSKAIPVPGELAGVGNRLAPSSLWGTLNATHRSLPRVQVRLHGYRAPLPALRALLVER